MIWLAATVGQVTVVEIVTQAAPGPFVNVYRSYACWAVSPAIGPGQALTAPHTEASPLRPSRPVIVVSPAASVPLTVVGVAHTHVGSVKLNELDPPLKFTVKVNRIGVPHTNDGDVLTEKGTVFVEEAPSAVLGYGEFGWVMVTPGVAV